MHGSSRKSGSATPPMGVTGGPAGAAGVAGRLASEFNAPVGLLDPKRGTWVVQLGAPASAFPRLGPGLVGASAAHGRAVVWKGDGGLGRVWLLVPLDLTDGAFVAAAGFAAGAPAAPGESVVWGPSCPEPALRAWGQSVAEQLRPAPAPRDLQTSSQWRAHAPVAAAPAPAAPAPAAAPAVEGGDRLIVTRLIRRLRISDPPGRFQQMATNALRTVLGVQAVAWVPTHPAEPVVACGEVGALKPNGFRALSPGAEAKGVVHVDNRPAAPPDTAVVRTLAVAADAQGSAGWLIAVNPVDGRDFTPADGDRLQSFAALIAAQLVNARVYADLKDLLFGVIRALTAAIDAKDPYTSGHSERVARIAVRLGQELGMTANQCGDLYLTGLLHDVGKIGVDDAVLKKPGPLTPEEYRQIQAHVEIGVHILADLKKLNHLLPGVRHHHESLDGTGYPCGLAGDAIPIEARILAVADSYDAMSSTRPYRRRLTPSQIDEILHKGSGVQWDPRVIEALFNCRMDLEMIRQKGLGESLQLAVSETLGRS